MTSMRVWYTPSGFIEVYEMDLPEWSHYEEKRAS